MRTREVGPAVPTSIGTPSGKAAWVTAIVTAFLWIAPAVAAVPPGFADVAEQVMPAYVDIVVSQRAPAPAAGQQTQQGTPFDQFFRDFFDQVPNAAVPRERSVSSQGSGFIFDKSGLVVTNNHVIDGAGGVTVILHDGTRLAATVLGRDQRGDLAVLKIEAGRELPFLRWGNSDTARIGDWVLALGNPLGQGRSLSLGIISGR